MRIEGTISLALIILVTEYDRAGQHAALEECICTLCHLNSFSNKI
jgi:hypothetical protein